MPTFTWQVPADGIKQGPYPSDSCFGRIFNSADRYNIDVHYALHPYHVPDPIAGTGGSKEKKDDVFAHVALLNRAGFKVSVDIVTDNECITRHQIPGKQEYRFHIDAGANSLIMTKFALNGIRWAADIPDCMNAFKLLVEESGATEPYEVFNCFLIASQAAYKTNQHNLAVANHAIIVPVTEAEYRQLLTSKSMEAMTRTYKTVTAYTSKNQEATGGDRLVWLLEAGAYKKYLALLDEVTNEAATARKTLVDDIRTALGNFAPAAGPVPAG